MSQANRHVTIACADCVIDLQSSFGQSYAWPFVTDSWIAHTEARWYFQVIFAGGSGEMTFAVVCSGLLKLSAHWNETETKLFWNSFITVSLFQNCFISVSFRCFTCRCPMTIALYCSPICNVWRPCRTLFDALWIVLLLLLLLSCGKNNAVFKVSVAIVLQCVLFSVLVR